MRTLATIAGLAAHAALAACAPQPQPQPYVPQASIMLQDMEKERARKDAAYEAAIAPGRKLLADMRRQAGFPPQEDVTATVLHCDRIIETMKADLLSCIHTRGDILAAESQEPSDIIASAAVASCQKKSAALVSAVVPYCIGERHVAERTVAGLQSKMREDVLARIVLRRAAKPPAPARGGPSPSTSI